jgi:hypothetical protein
MAVVEIINKQTCKDKILMRLVRRLVIAALTYNIVFRAKHIKKIFHAEISALASLFNLIL